MGNWMRIAACTWIGFAASVALADDPAVARRLARQEQVVSERLEQLNQKLDEIRMQASSKDLDETVRNTLLRESQQLNEQRNLNQIRLNELMEQQRQRRQADLQRAFGSECDIFFTQGSDPLTLKQLRFVDSLDVAGRSMLQFESVDGQHWTIDPSRITAVQIRKPDGQDKPEPAKPRG